MRNKLIIVMYNKNILKRDLKIYIFFLNIYIAKFRTSVIVVITETRDFFLYSLKG